MSMMMMMEAQEETAQTPKRHRPRLSMDEFSDDDGKILKFQRSLQGDLLHMRF
jgi:hypothetical protein